jgi:hypothetical protein
MTTKNRKLTGQALVLARLQTGPATADQLLLNCRASLRDMEKAGLIEWREKLWHLATPKCPACVEWAATNRPCTAAIYGECDCPKCQGLCSCEEK